MIKKVWVDLDGVFADFQSSFERHCGFPYYSDPQRAWKILENVDRLFLHLAPLPNAEQFYHDIKSLGVPIEFLTAMPQLTKKLATTPTDKKLWVSTVLDPKAKVTCVANWSHKQNFARPDHVLIDDSKRNIDQWIARGGIGIWHTDQKETMHRLKELLTN